MPEATFPIRYPAPAVLLLFAASLLGGCSGGDLFRTRDDMRNDDMHRWIGAEATSSVALRPSQYQLTDDERQLRDLAYPLIEPPYDRQRWYGVLNEYGVGRIFRQDWSRFDALAYTRALTGETLRSEAARYARLGNDIRNDRLRVPPFFLLASRVLEMDRRRELNLDAVSNLTPRDELNAVGRNAENALLVSWVQWSLMARTVSYRMALERLAVASPMPVANDIEHSLMALQKLIADHRVLPGPDFAPGPGGATLPPYDGPMLGPNGLPVRFPAVGAIANAASPNGHDSVAAPMVQPIY